MQRSLLHSLKHSSIGHLRVAALFNSFLFISACAIDKAYFILSLEFFRLYDHTLSGNSCFLSFVVMLKRNKKGM